MRPTCTIRLDQRTRLWSPPRRVPGWLMPSKEKESMTQERDLALIDQALDGARGPSQRAIAAEAVQWAALILRKNADYGDSVFSPPVLAPHIEPPTAMLVRMSDKVKRIAQLVSKGTAEVSDESLDDSIRDLGAYCLLYLARPKTE